MYFLDGRWLWQSRGDCRKSGRLIRRDGLPAQAVVTMGAVPFDRQTRNVRILDEQSVAGANGPCGDEIASGRLAAGQRQLRRDSLRSRLLFFVGRRRRRVLAKNKKIKCY